MKQVYDFLEQGYPVITCINGWEDLRTDHWVTVYQYTGTSTDGSNLKPEDFMCVDPYYGDKCRLNTAANYVGIRSVCIYAQNTCS